MCGPSHTRTSVLNVAEFDTYCLKSRRCAFDTGAIHHGKVDITAIFLLAALVFERHVPAIQNTFLRHR